MGTNFKQLVLPDNSIDKDRLFADIKANSEELICHNEFVPSIWSHVSPIFTNEFRTWLESFGCSIYRAEAFHIFPGNSLAWHLDTNDYPGAQDLTPTYSTKLNFFWGDLKNCYVEYGETTLVPGGKFATVNPRGRKTWIYREEFMVVTESTTAEYSLLTNRGVPHRARNSSTEDLICLSCVIGLKDLEKPLLYTDAVSIFESVCML